MTKEGRQYIFRLPKGYKWVFSVGFAFFLALTVFTLLLPVLDPEENYLTIAPLALVALGLSGLTVWGLRHVDDYVVADDSGLTHVVRGQETHLKWLDVRSVDHKTTRLKVTDAQGRSVMLDYALDGFHRLRDLIVDRTENLALNSLLPREFHRDSGVRTSFTVALAVALTVAIFWMWFEGASGSDLFLVAAFLALMVSTLFPGVRRVTVTAENLIVQYFLKPSEIPYAEISWISLGEQGGEGVVVRLRRGQTIRLGHFKEGTVEFYRLLKSVWEKAQEQPK